MDDSKLYNPARFKLWTNDHVRFCDLDALGHVNNNSMGMYFENARARLFSLITPGWPWSPKIFVLVRTCISFIHELHIPARLKIGTCITKVGHTSMHVANALYRGEQPIAYSEAISVLIDQKTRDPQLIGADLREVFKPYLENKDAAVVSVAKAEAAASASMKK
ncbi:MAG: thioesterase family protein [Alphaproteobacteria bacterium]|nr:thioesterase family protein [Alphaproteobacteria bacterium]